MPRENLLRELILFLKENKKWWLLPFILVFSFLALLVFIAQSAPVVAPFIYSLF
jgi:hypothetical protein